MNIRIHHPYCIHEIGKRETNQDNIFPSKEVNGSYDLSNLFLVCDGVGGAAKGEIASKLVCDTLSNCHAEKSLISEEQINMAIKIAEQKINEYAITDGDSTGMATTLTLLALHNDGATIAHVGDSRVYQVRRNKILFKTVDHSFVNELVNQKIISESEASTHPKRNVITRAIGGESASHNADVSYIKDIEMGDYFFLCTDGVLESLSDEELTNILDDENLLNFDKVKKIEDLCAANSKDNFSAYLIQIEAVNTDN